MKQSSQESSDWPDPADWIEEHFYIPELKGPIELEPYQRAALREALRRDESGDFVYSTIIWSDVKKSAKSTICAAVVLYFAMHTLWGEIYMIANDLKQADSRVAKYFRRALDLNPNYKGAWSQRGYMMTMKETRTTVEAVPIDPSGEAGSNADLIQFCLDKKTEVLTKAGWKKWHELLGSDYYATRNPVGKFEWQKAYDVYSDWYSGPMIGTTQKSVNMLVTPNHRVYGKFYGGDFPAPDLRLRNTTIREYSKTVDNQFCKAHRAKQSSYFFPELLSEWVGGEAKRLIIPATYKINGHGQKYAISQEEKTISPKLYAEFMGWYLSEGCVVKDDSGISIGQSEEANPEHRKRIIEMLIEMGLKPKEQGMSIVVYHSELAKLMKPYGLSGTKYIPDDIKNMPKEILQTFLDAFVAGDGSINKFGGIQICLKSERLRDGLTEVAQKCGYTIFSAEREDNRWDEKKTSYCVYLRSKTSTRKPGQILKKHWYTKEYTGVVFCPSTDNGVIYVRREGSYYWTGNSELWGAHESAKQKMFAEMTLSPTKHGQSLRWIESYAGYTDESELLYGLYKRGIDDGELVWPDKLFHSNFSPDSPLNLKSEGRMLCLWNQEPRCPWQTAEYYSEEEKLLMPGEFRRMHRNEWVTSIETFVPIEWWDACKVDVLPEITPKTAMIISLDAGVSSDPFGMIMVYRDPLDKERVVLKYAKRWLPPKGGKINFQGTEQRPGPEMELERLIGVNNVVMAAYDPYQLEDMAGRWRRKRVIWMYAFEQGARRLKADSMLRAKIRDKGIVHDGSFDDLRQNILNANAKITSEELEDSKLRIVKKTKDKKVDLVVALSMAVHEAMRLNI